jgi:alpha-mannosidase
MNRAAKTNESGLRARLSIPPGAEKVLILSQSSHLDWDWLLPFPILFDNSPQTTSSYFSTNTQPASVIFTDAASFLCPNGQPNPAYYYSVCEMGFLQAFAEKYAEQFGILIEAGDNLHIVGGGVTSPDNLLPHGECFIRNYLVGSLWAAGALGLPIVNAWLPDDFGQDSQLPVMFEAMGFTGVSFWRVPGASPYSLQPVDGQPSVSE